jgi:hypothetical protein
MPNHRLKRLGMGRDGRRIDHENEDVRVRGLCGEAAIAADNPANGGAHIAGVFESANQVGFLASPPPTEKTKTMSALFRWEPRSRLA